MTSRVVYGWGEARSFKVSAQVVGETFESIEAKRGQVTPAVVVDEARPEESPLHGFFEWNNDKAADHYRHDQARSLIQAVVVKAYDGQENRNPTRAFVSVSQTDGRSYVGVVTAMSDKELRAQVLARAQREIEEWRERYRALNEFSKLFAVIDKLAVKEPSRRRKQSVAAASASPG